MDVISKLNIFEDVLIIGGVSISIPMIESILGIVILSFQIILIIVKGATKLYTAIKEKKMDEIDDIIKNTNDDLEKITHGKNDGK